MSVGHSMRAAAREIFLHALAEASIEKAFDRHVQCHRGVLRICDDLHDLSAHNRTVTISFGTPRRTFASAS